VIMMRGNNMKTSLKGAAMKRVSILFSAAIIAGACSASVRGQSLLDQQLGGPTPAPGVKNAEDLPLKVPPPAAPEAKPDQPKPANPTAGPAGGDISSPSAVRTVDDQDLTNKLLHPEDKPDPNKVKQQMKEALDRMGQVQSLLQEKKETGAVTQETERRIMMDLDVLIDFARKQQQNGPSQPQDPNQQKDPQQSRTYSQGNKPGQGQGGNVAAAADVLPGGGQDTPTAAADIHAKGDQWGDLRPVERDLINNGAHEDYVSSYREMINHYYMALGELGKTRSR